MDSSQSGQWVKLTSFLGLYGEVEADLLVAALEGSGIPAVRLPVEPQTVLVSALVVILPVVVLVPADHLDRAQEVLAEQPPRMTIPPPVRSVARWWLVMTTAAFGAGACAFAAAGEGFVSWLATQFTIVPGVAGLFLLRAGVRLIAWLRRKHRPLAGAHVILVSLVAGLAFIALAALLAHLATFFTESPMLQAWKSILHSHR